MPIELKHHRGILGPDARGNEMEQYFTRLCNWTDGMNASDILREYFELFNRPASLDQLHISAARGIGYVTSAFYADCNFTLIVSDAAIQSNPPNGICVGFNIVPDLNEYFPHMPYDYRRHSAQIDPGDLVISQLQAGGYNNRNFTRGWRWEQALVTLVAGWSAHEKLGRVLIWPGELVVNDFCLTDDERQRFTTRYNGTANALGFKRNTQKIYVQPN